MVQTSGKSIHQLRSVGFYPIHLRGLIPFLPWKIVHLETSHTSSRTPFSTSMIMGGRVDLRWLALGFQPSTVALHFDFCGGGLRELFVSKKSKNGKLQTSQGLELIALKFASD